MEKLNEKKGLSFSFDLGDPIPILDKSDFLGYFECFQFEKWLEPPVKFTDISRLLYASSHHQSALEVKKNVLLSTIKIEKEIISADVLEQFIYDFLVFGNAYLQFIKNRFKENLKAVCPLAKFVRTNLNNEYYFIANYTNEVKLKNVFHLKNIDINQNIYGMPSYLGAIQSLLLNESATLFRRKYYVNGAHAGSIIYLNDSQSSLGEVEKIKNELMKTKGKGNFKNVFIYTPNGSPDGLKVIPLSDSMGKDEFLTIKNTSRDDILAAHRVPPQLLSILPNNTGGFGDVSKAAKIFFINEIKPLQRKLEIINTWAGDKVISFTDYELLEE